ncbi:class I SAM-dependent methyltransferase [Nonomuraea sp. KC401]|nr:methyltransferase domain-containing protein [Nonomuraea sp. K271]TLF80735.1 class I SAM-dependent methyltransferase [Nonomuraea sp. KC401]
MDDPVVNALITLHHGLPRQGPGSDATTRRLLALARPLPGRPKVLDLGCGPGRASLLLAAAGAEVTSIDTHQPYLDELREAAARRGLAERIRTVNVSMAELPCPDHSFDMIWAEGSVYLIGFDHALRSWRRLLTPGGVLVVTECEWSTSDPAPEVRAYWEQAYPLRGADENTAAAAAAGYRVCATYRLPDSDWFEEYYAPLGARADAADLSVPGMAQAVAMTRQEIGLRRDHADDYGYTGYVLRVDGTDAATPAMS